MSSREWCEGCKWMREATHVHGYGRKDIRRYSDLFEWEKPFWSDATFCPDTPRAPKLFFNNPALDAIQFGEYMLPEVWAYVAEQRAVRAARWTETLKKYREQQAAQKPPAKRIQLELGL